MNLQSYGVVWLDHPFVLLFGVLFPALGYLSYQRSFQKLASGELARSDQYRLNATIQQALALIALALWYSQDRGWGALGLNLEIDTNFLLSLLLVALTIWFFLAQLLAVRRGDHRLLEKLEVEFEPLRELMPHTKEELHGFYRLSVTAGVVEELLWRGYLMWYLSHYLPLSTTVVVSAVLFGFAHAYQGIANVPKLCLVGLVFPCLYLFSGSLWLPMLLHAAMDGIQGRMAYDFFRARPKH